MRKILFYTLLLVILSSLNIYADNDTILLNPNWEIGDKADYVISRTSYQNDELKTDMETTLHLEVIDKDEDGYVFKWSMGTKNPISNIINKLTETLSGNDNDDDLHYRIDNNGNFIGFTDMSKVNMYMEYIKKNFSKEIDKMEDISEKEKDSLKNNFNMLFQSDEQIISFLTRDIFLFHYQNFYFYEYDRDTIYTGNTEIANPLGGQSIPGKMELIARKQFGTSLIKVNQKLDKQRAAEFLVDFVTRISKNSDFEVTEDNIIKELDIIDNFICTFKDGAKWPKKIEHTRTAIIMGERRIDKTIIKRIE